MNNNLNNNITDKIAIIQNNITDKIAIIQNNIETEKANTLKDELKKFLLQEIKNILKSRKTEYYIFYRLPIKELEKILYDIVKEKVDCSKEISYEVINKILNDYEEDVKYCETLEKHLLFTLENNLKKENIEFEKLTNNQLLNELSKIKNSEKFFKPLQINNKILDRLKFLRKNNQFEEIEEKNLKEEFIPVLGEYSNFFNIFNTTSFNINKIEKEFNEKKENEINKYLKNFLITEAEKTNNLKNYNSNELKKLLINIAENNEEIKKHNESFIINLIDEILMEHSNKQKENIKENLEKSKDFNEVNKNEKELNETEKEKTLKKLIEDARENLYLNIENLGKNSDITINEILVDLLNFSANYTKEEKKYLNNLISKNKLFEKVENLKEFEISTSKKDEKKLSETEKEKALKKLIEDARENLDLNIENLGKNSDITINEILLDFLSFSTNYTKKEIEYLNNLILNNKLFEIIKNLKEFEISTSKKNERENVFENYAIKDDEEIEIIEAYTIENEKEKNIFKNDAIKNNEEEKAEDIKNKYGFFKDEKNLYKNDENISNEIIDEKKLYKNDENISNEIIDEKNLYKETISNEITEEEKQMALTKFSANLNSLAFKVENLKENSADANKEILKYLLEDESENKELEYKLNEKEKKYLKKLIENGTILEKLERFLD